MAQDESAEAVLRPSVTPALMPVLRPLARLGKGTLRVHWHSRTQTLVGSEGGPDAEIRLHRPWRVAARVASAGDLGVGESYMNGDWDTPNLANLLYLLALNEPSFHTLVDGSWLHRLGALLRHRRNRNSRVGSRRNISYHYDLGNDFYRLWLDPGMTYSAALFGGRDDNLEQAQRSKYRALLDLIDARPGQHILEIGCGWGGFALEAARAGLRVTGITLSKEQLSWAREQAARHGLADRIELRLQDYRDLGQTFDHIVSIEMFEAVGEDYWPAFMKTLRRSLRPGGRAALQVITIDEACFPVYRSRPDFIQRHIFPGGMLPSPERFGSAARGAGLAVTGRSFHGLDYARTLADWHRRFLHQVDAIRALGYGERFIRMWRYYLAYCEAGFRDGRIDLMQVRLEPSAQASADPCGRETGLV
jgi:cyclopropane-fatty-acyl-phospholipid synthase